MTSPAVGSAAPGTSEGPYWLELRGLAKSFGGVQALKGVSLGLRRGTVHGLVGANGAGKSTLIRSLAGVVTPDSGEVLLEGRRVTIASPHDASALGLAFIHQEISLVPTFDVLRNMALGIRPKTRCGVIDWGPMHIRATQVAERLGMRFPLTARAEDLGTAEQWLVLIGRALMRDAAMIAMDEPTASLSAREAERVFAVVRDLVANDVAVVYVSHRLDEVLDLCDDITVFKDGEVVHRAARGEVGKPELVRAIVGSDVDLVEEMPTAGTRGRTVLEVRGVSDKKLLRDVSITVHEGEVLGLAGLVGAGRTELARIIYGDTKPVRGEVLLNGKRLRLREPADAVAAGVGYVPEERRSEALFLDRSVDFNINIASLRSMRVLPWLPVLRMRRARDRARALGERLRVKAAGVGEVVHELSGGNQQKVVIARWLTRNPRVLILDEPSRGVDVGARAEIHRIIREFAVRGTAVIAISSDVEELVGLCDRVLVMAEGRVRAELEGDTITRDRIIALSYAGVSAGSMAKETTK